METMIESVRAWPWDVIAPLAAITYTIVMCSTGITLDTRRGASGANIALAFLWPLWLPLYLASHPLRRLGRWWREREAEYGALLDELVEIRDNLGYPRIQTALRYAGVGLADLRDEVAALKRAKPPADPAPEQPGKRAEEATLNTAQDCCDDAWSLLLRAKASRAADPDVYDDPDDSDGPADSAPKNFNSLDGFSPGDGGPTPYGSKPSEDAKPVRHDAHVALEARVVKLQSDMAHADSVKLWIDSLNARVAALEGKQEPQQLVRYSEFYKNLERAGFFADWHAGIRKMVADRPRAWETTGGNNWYLQVSGRRYFKGEALDWVEVLELQAGFPWSMRELSTTEALRLDSERREQK